jgi:hypothetical protein
MDNDSTMFVISTFVVEKCISSITLGVLSTTLKKNELSLLTKDDI